MHKSLLPVLLYVTLLASACSSGGEPDVVAGSNDTAADSVQGERADAPVSDTRPPDGGTVDSSENRQWSVSCDASVVLANEPGETVTRQFDDATVLFVGPNTSAGASVDGVVQVVAQDLAGPDRLEFSVDSGRTWKPLPAVDEIESVAASPDGSQVAFVDGSSVGLLTIPAELVSRVELPTKDSPTSVSFDEDGELLLTLSDETPGVPYDLASKQDLWRRSRAGEWTRLTDVIADDDRWSIAEFPIDRGGVLYVVLETGLGSGTREDVQSTFASVEPGQRISAIAEVPIDAVLLDVLPSGATIWNYWTAEAGWALVMREADGRTRQLGCGRSSSAPTDAPDPDLMAEEGG
jgi:hypothetical protein